VIQKLNREDAKSAKTRKDRLLQGFWHIINPEVRGKQTMTPPPVENPFCLNIADYPQPGLYLLLEDRSRMTLTREMVEKVTAAYWRDPRKIPPAVKEAVLFQRCPICPKSAEEDFCDALRPVLPFLEIIDTYTSFQQVLAVYRPESENMLYVSHTTLQVALKYLAILSLMRYCQVGKKYWKYYMGIAPIVRGEEFASRMYLNAYWLHRGDLAGLERFITIFVTELETVTENQMTRLGLICQNDAFLNAFSSAYNVLELLKQGQDLFLVEALAAWK
jgi:hypothetical protein